MDQEKIAELLDREAIRDCLCRYCRGVDRADEAAIRSSYWSDAHDDHGAALGVFKTGPRNVHQITNILIEFISPAEAAVESYFSAMQRGKDKDGEVRQMLRAAATVICFRRGKGVADCRTDGGLRLARGADPISCP